MRRNILAMPPGVVPDFSAGDCWVMAASHVQIHAGAKRLAGLLGHNPPRASDFFSMVSRRGPAVPQSFACWMAVCVCRGGFSVILADFAAKFENQWWST